MSSPILSFLQRTFSISEIKTFAELREIAKKIELLTHLNYKDETYPQMLILSVYSFYNRYAYNFRPTCSKVTDYKVSTTDENIVVTLEDEYNRTTYVIDYYDPTSPFIYVYDIVSKKPYKIKDDINISPSSSEMFLVLNNIDSVYEKALAYINLGLSPFDIVLPFSPDIKPEVKPIIKPIKKANKTTDTIVGYTFIHNGKSVSAILETKESVTSFCFTREFEV